MTHCPFFTLELKRVRCKPFDLEQYFRNNNPLQAQVNAWIRDKKTNVWKGVTFHIPQAMIQKFNGGHYAYLSPQTTPLWVLPRDRVFLSDTILLRILLGYRDE